MFSERPLVDSMRGAEPPVSSLEWHQAFLFICVLLPLHPLQRPLNPDPGKEGFFQGQPQPISSKAEALGAWHVLLELWPC